MQTLLPIFLKKIDLGQEFKKYLNLGVDTVSGSGKVTSPAAIKRSG